jgi:hypothetical protein
MTIKSKKVRRAEITFGKVISAEKTGRQFYFSSVQKKVKKSASFLLYNTGVRVESRESPRLKRWQTFKEF